MSAVAARRPATELLGTESIPRLLVRYALPAIIAMTSASLYNIVDSIFIGHGVGSMGLAGLAISMPLMNLMSAFGAMVGVGAASMISIRLGQGNVPRALMILGNAAMLNLIFGVTVGVAAWLGLDRILLFFGASEQTLPYARDYMRVILLGNVSTHLFLGLNEIVRASGHPLKSMAVMLVAVLGNCALDWIAIFVLEWGVKGAAIATVTAQCVSLAILLFHFSDRRHLLHFVRRAFRLRRVIIGNILSIGLSPFLLNVCASAVVIFINQALMQHGGDLYVGAYGIVNRVVLLFVMIIAGLNQGMQPIVGYNYGAYRFDRVRKALWITIVAGVLVGTLGFLLGRVFPAVTAGIFVDSSDPDEAGLIAASIEGLRIVMLLFPAVGFQIVSSNFFQYIGKARKAIFLSLTRQLLFLIPLLNILPRYYGTYGVWISMPVADSIAVLLTALLLFFQLRQFRHPERVRMI